jgi:hypothetical protein
MYGKNGQENRSGSYQLAIPRVELAVEGETIDGRPALTSKLQIH